MTSDWELRKLGDICDLVNGSTPLKSNKAFWENGDYPWFTIDDLREQGRVIRWTRQKVTEAAIKKLRVLPVSTVLLCCTASIGEFAITEIELTTNQQFNGLVIKDRDLIAPKFLMYFCSTLKEKLAKLSGKTTIDFIPISRLKEIEIPIPSLPTQHRIVSILDSAFAAIDKAKANAEKNLQNAKELFESYLQSVFANPGEDWEERRLGDVCEIESKLVDPRQKQYQALFHVGGGNIVSKVGSLVDLKTAREEKLISGKFLFNDSMVLYSKIRPYLMKVVRPDFEGLCSADIYPLKPISNEVIRDYLYYLLLTKDFTEYAIKGSARAGMPKVNREHLFEYRFFRPPISTQSNCVESLDEMSSQTRRLESTYIKKLSDLEELKKSILRLAFNGELKATVKELA